LHILWKLVNESQRKYCEQKNNENQQANISTKVSAGQPNMTPTTNIATATESTIGG